MPPSASVSRPLRSKPRCRPRITAQTALPMERCGPAVSRLRRQTSQAIASWLRRMLSISGPTTDLQPRGIEAPALLELLERVVEDGGRRVVGQRRLRRLDPGGHRVPVVLRLEEAGERARAIEPRDGVEQAALQARAARMLQPRGRRGQGLGVLGLLAAGLQHLVLGHGALGRVHVDVLAEVPELLQVLLVADLEALEEEWRLQPRAIELRHVHAALEVGGLDLESFEEHGQTLAAGIRPAGTLAIIFRALRRGRAAVTLLRVGAP